MSEIIGQVKPIGIEEANAILERHMPRVRAAQVAAQELRKRVASGAAQTARIRGLKAQHAPTGVSDEELADAEARLDALRLSLRQEEGYEALGMGMALATAMATVLGEAGKEDGWKPPPGSHLKVIMPGLLNVAIDLERK